MGSVSKYQLDRREREREREGGREGGWERGREGEMKQHSIE